jgi:hypothetical protein
VINVHEGAGTIVDGLTRNRHVVGIHDAVNETNEHPFRDQFRLARNDRVKQRRSGSASRGRSEHEPDDSEPGPDAADRGPNGHNLDQDLQQNGAPGNYVYYVETGLPLPTGPLASVALRDYDQTTYGNIQVESDTGYSNYNGRGACRPCISLMKPHGSKQAFAG